MDSTDPVARITVPLGGQQIELRQVDFGVAGTGFLRVRIREGHRFTVLDIDPATAAQWAEAMQGWARAQAWQAQAGEAP